jgi:tRNA(adenine34) deaminase
MSEDDDLKFLRLAIEASRSALRAGNSAFGAALADRTGKLAHVAGNNQITAADSTGHAEVVVVREVAQRFGADTLAGSTVYASGEPCAMCSGAMFWAGVSRVVFAASHATIVRILGAPSLALSSREVLKGASRAVEIVGPLLEDEAVRILVEMAEVRKRGASS